MPSLSQIAMSHTPEDLFQLLVDTQIDRPGVTAGRMFGSPVLKVDGKVYAMLVKSQLVVKLPRQRADELLGSGFATPFDPGHGRPSKEWVAVDPSYGDRWPKLVYEAWDLVKGLPVGRKSRK
jgi:hypothetical protein